MLHRLHSLKDKMVQDGLCISAKDENERHFSIFSNTPKKDSFEGTVEEKHTEKKCSEIANDSVPQTSVDKETVDTDTPDQSAPGKAVSSVSRQTSLCSDIQTPEKSSAIKPRVDKTNSSQEISPQKTMMGSPEARQGHRKPEEVSPLERESRRMAERQKKIKRALSPSYYSEDLYQLKKSRNSNEIGGSKYDFSGLYCFTVWFSITNTLQALS